MALGLTLPPAMALMAAGHLLEVPPVLSALAALLLLIPAVVVPGIAYRRWRYCIREFDLLISRGAIRHIETLVPFDRIQFVESRQGPLERMFSLTQVGVFTAAGQAGRIPGLDHATAESIRDELSKVAGTTSV